MTTEGGLDLVQGGQRAVDAVRRLSDAGIKVSLFLDPDPKQIELAAAMKAHAIELHTGEYALAANEATQAAQLRRLTEAGRQVIAAG